jgi:ATP-dependent Clp protease adaptor protein ClpS
LEGPGERLSILDLIEVERERVIDAVNPMWDARRSDVIYHGTLRSPRASYTPYPSGGVPSMSDIVTKPRIKNQLETQRPRLHKVILVNDDYTPREFVVTILKAEFRMSEEQAYRVMMTAHRRGVCVVAVYQRDIAETKATRATEAGRSKGYPLMFTTEPEE